VSVTLVEVLPELVERARNAAAEVAADVEVVAADAGRSQTYVGLGTVPVDIVLLVGVLGNVSNADVAEVALAPADEVERRIKRRLRRWPVQGHPPLAQNLLHGRNQPRVVELLKVVLALPDVDHVHTVGCPRHHVDDEAIWRVVLNPHRAAHCFEVLTADREVHRQQYRHLGSSSSLAASLLIRLSLIRSPTVGKDASEAGNDGALTCSAATSSIAERPT
jgi:hypothetical protein